MKSHVTESFLPADPLFHVVRPDGLYQPIRFVFVNERMRSRIQCERGAILTALPAAARAHQQRVFREYDPDARHRRYRGLLDLFEVSAAR